MPEQRDRGCLSPICPLGPPVDAVVARMGGKKHSRKVANCRRTQQDTVTKRGFLADTAKDEKVIHWAEGCIEGKGLGVIRLRGKIYCYRQQGDFLPGRGFG